MKESPMELRLNIPTGRKGAFLAALKDAGIEMVTCPAYIALYIARLNEPISALNLDARASNVLCDVRIGTDRLGRPKHIRYVGELVRCRESDLLMSKNCGKKTLALIISALAKRGFVLGDKLEDWTPPD